MLKTFNNLSFKLKLIIITLPMFLGNLMWGNLVVFEHGMMVLDAKKVQANLSLIKEISSSIQTLQDERELSFLYLTNDSLKNELSKKRESTDLILKNLNEKFLKMDNSLQQNLSEISKLSNEFRKIADTHGSFADLFKTSEETMGQLIRLETKLAGLDHFKGLESSLNTLVLFDMAKEKMNLFKLGLINILKKDIKIDYFEIDKIESLKTGFLFSINFPNLQTSDETKKKITSLLTSSEWPAIEKSFGSILKNSATGHYEQSQSDLTNNCNHITKLLNSVLSDESNFINTKIEKEIKIVQFWFWSASLFLTFATITVAILLISLLKTIIKDLKNVTERLVASADKLNESSSGLSTTSNDLSSSTTNQASALQETASAIHEVSSMVAQNSTSTNDARDASSESTNLANIGQISVLEMMKSISNISDGNEEIIQAVAKGNDDITQIVKVIEEIGIKTKVINDIVFQTKLLSFNASVEAARAGEHGKGFSVVAEEIGKLAQMSGNSAKEIEIILSQSTTQVQEIINNTKNRVDRLSAEGKKSISMGIVTAEKCKTSLYKLLESVQKVDIMISSIALASDEQSRGINEINIAVTQLDQLTHQNARGAGECAGAAEDLSEQSQSIKYVAQDLREFIEGK